MESNLRGWYLLTWHVFLLQRAMFCPKRIVVTSEMLLQFYAHSAGVFTNQVANPTLVYIFELFQLFFQLV